ncbi:MAG: proteasome subunit beta [archaeon]|nr:proteasome subunit beta [archaeon]MDA1131031.1 proteasome subunit beta [archaeon]
MMDTPPNVVKTGTSTIGITFAGGVVVGADHRATMGHFIANKNVQKLFRIGKNLALTTAGLVGHAQSLSRTLSAEISLFELRRQQPMTVKGAATMTANILVGKPHWVQLLIVGVDEDGGHVYSIDSAGGSIPDSYCATGSGSPYMYGVLEDNYTDGMTRSEALKLAARALYASGQRDAASGNGMDLAVITAKDGYQQVSAEEISKLLK